METVTQSLTRSLQGLSAKVDALEDVCLECPDEPLKEWRVVYDRTRMGPLDRSRADDSGAASGMQMRLMRRGTWYVLECTYRRTFAYTSDRLPGLDMLRRSMDAAELALFVHGYSGGTGAMWERSAAHFALEFSNGITVKFYLKALRQ